jgi:electron transport complex protein RnfC
MALRRPVDTIICSVLDSDPTMRIQGAMCATYPEDLEAGMTLLLQCCQASRGFVVVEAWSPATWSVPVRKVLRGTPIKLVELANDYPQADPSLMLYTIARRRLRPGRLPVERATLLLDAAAVIAVGRTARGKPALPVHMGLRDRASGISYYIAAIDGTPLNHILADLPLTRPYILRGGDLLRDCRLGDDTTICAADERIIHVCPAEAVVNPEPCIRCAWCVESCPTRVHPALLLEAAQEHNLARARWAGLDACIECGICVHVCPSQLPILDGIRQLKLIVEDQDARPEAQRRGKSDVVAEDAPGDL